MFVESELIASSRMALSIPYDAVIIEENQSFVLL